MAGRPAFKGIALVGAMAVFGLSGAQTRLWVAPNGSDTFTGFLSAPNGNGDGPKATLEAARQTIRALKLTGNLSPLGAIVTVRPGRYKIKQPLTFGLADMGNSGARVIWRSEVPGQAILDGSREVTQWLPANQRPPLTKIAANVRGYIQVANLGANGITESGRMGHVGPNIELMPQNAELFFNEKRMNLAKWPNGPQVTITGTGSGNSFDTPTTKAVLSGLKTPDYTWNTGNQNDPFTDYWIQGTLNERLFNQFHERVSWINKAFGDVRIRITEGNVADHARRADYWYRAPGRFALVNSIYELDAPGEYFIDRQANQLYFFPPSSMSGKRIALSMLAGPMVELLGVKYFDWQGFLMEGGRQDAVHVENCVSVVLRGCKIRNFGANGVKVRAGASVQVRSCEIFDVGEAGVDVEAGDRSLLVKANHLVDNNYIHDVGANQPYYRPGIKLYGMGLTARNNQIRNHRHAAILFHGNEILVEKNKIHKVVTDACDAAAIYAGADWTTRGNIVRNNYIEDVKQLRSGYHLTHGIYLDDMFSSCLVEGNVFRRVEQPIQVGGGHHNAVVNNVFIDCLGAIRIDDRGIYAPEGWISDFFREANKVDWQGTAWKTKYPEVFALLSSTDYRIPSKNRIELNVAMHCYLDFNRVYPMYELWGVNASGNPNILSFKKNIATDAQQFVNSNSGDFTPTNNSAAKANGFQGFTMADWGVKKDSFIDPSLWGG